MAVYFQNIYSCVVIPFSFRLAVMTFTTHTAVRFVVYDIFTRLD